MTLKNIATLCVIAFVMVDCYRSSSPSAKSSDAAAFLPATAKKNSSYPSFSLFLMLPEYLAWANAPSSTRVNFINISGFTYQFEYTPTDLIALQHLRNKTITAASVAEEKKALGDFQYYTFRLCAPNGIDIVKYRTASEQDKEQRSHYFSYEMEHDIRLVDGADTLKCTMYHYEKSFGVSPCTNFLLAFQVPDPARPIDQTDKTIVLQDKVFGNGLISVKLTSKNLKKIPSLVFNPSQE
jgi:hypothetical protein